jgi:hypothetical protein
VKQALAIVPASRPLPWPAAGGERSEGARTAQRQPDTGCAPTPFPLACRSVNHASVDRTAPERAELQPWGFDQIPTESRLAGCL